MEYLGQHFLKNPIITERTLKALDLREGECVIEIGPGKGALTHPLLKLCREKKARYIGIEKDPVLATELSSVVTTPDTSIVVADALHALPNMCEELARNKQPYRIVGNIPYYITGFLLRTISELPTKPLATVLLIQKEVAERMCSPEGNLNLLSASVQVWAEPSIVCIVPAKDFDPPPQVTSAVVKLVTRHNAESYASLAEYYAMLKICFKQPRKTLLNNLSEIASKEEIQKIFLELDIAPLARPQYLTIAHIKALAHHLQSGAHIK